MRVRSGRLAFLLGLLFLAPGLASAQKMDKDDKAWLDGVRPVMLSDEEKLYKTLKDRSDRLEFQRIFWARRDPDLTTPVNEYQAEYVKARAAADQAYRVPATAGSLTDCGRVFILLGKPDDVQQEPGTLSPGLRPAETWTYRDRPGRTFTGGQATIAFDDGCRAPAALAPQMDRVAAALVLQPGLDYRRGKDGHLVKLEDMLPKDTPARALVKQPRQDFPLAVQAAYLKVADGGTALLGVVRGDAAGLTTAEGQGGKTANVAVAATAVAEDGKESGWTEQAMNVPVGPDGRFLASFKLPLRPGKYTLKAAAVDTKSGKGSLASLPVEVPDLAQVETAPDGSVKNLPSAGSVLFVGEIDDIPPGGKDDPAHPFAAFALGTMRLHALFGSTFAKADQVHIVYQVYDLSVDGATGKANATATLTILKDGKQPVAKQDLTIEGPVGGSVVGPVQLSEGKFVVRLKVTDNIAKKDLVQEVPLEIRP
jgi:GWxTD domain-containing protein